MTEKTHIAHVLDIAGDKAKYDERIKKLISDKQILAWILKYTSKEFKECTIEEIVECIEGEPEIAQIPVYPGKIRGEAITGLPTEDAVPNEGEVTYDIKFYAVTSRKERVKLIINIEAQKDYYPGYDLVTRALFYCARMLSAQLNTEFTAKNYDGVKKVYSIWICMDAPKYVADTITEYAIKQNKILGDFQGKARYDLLSAVMICLGKEDKEDNDISLHGLLSILLSEKLDVDKKTKILNHKYGIRTTTEMKEGMRQMCNLSDRIEEMGIQRGIEEGKQQGESWFAALAEKLLRDNRTEDLLKATNDKFFRETLYREYGIK